MIWYEDIRAYSTVIAPIYSIKWHQNNVPADEKKIEVWFLPFWKLRQGQNLWNWLSQPYPPCQVDSSSDYRHQHQSSHGSLTGTCASIASSSDLHKWLSPRGRHERLRWWEMVLKAPFPAYFMTHLPVATATRLMRTQVSWPWLNKRRVWSLQSDKEWALFKKKCFQQMR